MTKLAFRIHGKRVAPKLKQTETQKALVIPQGPSLPQKARNFAAAAAREAMAIFKGQRPRSEEEALAALEVCKGCPLGVYRAETDTCEHPSCGCQMGRKARWRSSFCPGGFWAAVLAKFAR